MISYIETNLINVFIQSDMITCDWVILKQKKNKLSHDLFIHIALFSYLQGKQSFFLLIAYETYKRNGF